MIMEGFAETFGEAKDRAAAELGAATPDILPTNIEVHRALARELAFREGEVWRQRVWDMRREASAAMDAFAEFEPCLIGSVLYGTATRFCPIRLHGFCDEAEAMSRKLISLDQRYSLTEQSFRLHRSREAAYPCFLFAGKRYDIEFSVLPLVHRQQIPISPLDGKPYRRADRQRLQQIIDAQVLFPFERITTRVA